MLRFLTGGESHGPAQTAILDGIPAGLEISPSDIQVDLEKRRGGYGRGGRGRIETDQVRILSGVRKGKTLGSPITLLVENLDFAHWKHTMNPDGSETKNAHVPAVTTPRPGHADLAGSIKFGTEDVRNILERASARETVMRVALGAVCRVFLKTFDIAVVSHTISIGHVRVPPTVLHERGSSDYFRRVASVFTTDSAIRCIDPDTSVRMKQLILDTTIAKDTLGGVVEIIARNVPIGLGSHVHWDLKLDGRLGGALLSIPSVKAVEIGEGISSAGMHGSSVHDEIFPFGEMPKKWKRRTNRAGGIEGGISNGEDIVCRVFHKPLSTLGNPLRTVDFRTKKAAASFVERSDICVVPRAGVVSEAMVLYVLAAAFLEKFGGDSMQEVIRHFSP